MYLVKPFFRSSMLHDFSSHVGRLAFSLSHTDYDFTVFSIMQTKKSRPATQSAKRDPVSYLQISLEVHPQNLFFHAIIAKFLQHRPDY
jgi:hypothetical protein